MAGYDPSKNKMVPPLGARSANPYGYHFWDEMRHSVYYDVPEFVNPYVFKYKGQDARLRVGSYEQDPRFMRLTLENRSGQTIYEITGYLRNAYKEVEWLRPNQGEVPTYVGLCKDCHFEDDDVDVFRQLEDLHLCVPIYTQSGRIAMRQAENLSTLPPDTPSKLPEYIFDDNVLRELDFQGMLQYDRNQEEYARWYDEWPGGTRSWALAIDNHYNGSSNSLLGWPSPDEFIGSLEEEANGDVLQCVLNPFDEGDAYAIPKNGRKRVKVEPTEIEIDGGSSIEGKKHSVVLEAFFADYPPDF